MVLRPRPKTMTKQEAMKPGKSRGFLAHLSFLHVRGSGGFPTAVRSDKGAWKAPLRPTHQKNDMRLWLSGF